MKYAYFAMILAFLSGCIPDDSCQKNADAEIQERIELHEQRSRDWGNMGETEVFEGFK